MRRPTLHRHIVALILGIGSLIGVAGSAGAAAPAITSFAPAAGTIGTNVTLSGSGFTGAMAVTFDGAASVFKVMGDKKIVATAPANLATGKISVRTPKGTGS